jgi:hypothetical protein
MNAEKSDADLASQKYLRYKSSIVARVEGDNYRFIYVGNNGADYIGIILAEGFRWAVVFGFTQRAERGLLAEAPFVSTESWRESTG